MGWGGREKKKGDANTKGRNGNPHPGRCRRAKPMPVAAPPYRERGRPFCAQFLQLLPFSLLFSLHNEVNIVLVDIYAFAGHGSQCVTFWTCLSNTLFFNMRKILKESCLTNERGSICNAFIVFYNVHDLNCDNPTNIADTIKKQTMGSATATLGAHLVIFIVMGQDG